MDFKKMIIPLLLALVFSRDVLAQPFVHPGILHSSEDLERMKKAVALKEEPIYSGFKIFIENPVSNSGYKMQGPMVMVGRNPTVGQVVYDTDANAAHQNAVMWAITGDKAYADKAIEIVNAWSSSLKSITGRDAVLMGGLGPFKMVNAAEILRYTHAGWSASDIKQTEKHFREVIYPVIKDFAPFANGNWDAAAIKTVLAIGVFCNDRPIFEHALQYYINGHGNGRLTNYIINEEGQIQESGRDQGHTQLGLAMLAESCEIAWHQGLDLYGYANNRLLKGFEYVAKFNLGDEVPFVETLDRTGKYHHKTIARQDRGPLRAVYEQLYNHYTNRMGMRVPYTQQAAEKIRPEGPGKPGADHPGYGTLFFTRPKENYLAKALAIKPTAPGALVATASINQVTVSWVPSIGAATYTVKRASREHGPFQSVTAGVKGTSFTDHEVKAGKAYYYTVSALNSKGESPNAYAVSVNAGLPHTWAQRTIGPTLPGSSAFDGKRFVIEAGGMGLDSLKDQCHFIYKVLRGDGAITLRYVPQLSSQFSSFGLMLRDELSESAAHTSLIIYPGRTTQIEAPGWHLRLVSRNISAQNTEVNYSGPNLTEPAVNFGRMTGNYWLKLERQGNKVFAFGSYDGKVWQAAGSKVISLKPTVYIGIVGASGIPHKTTTLMFDHVNVNSK